MGNGGNNTPLALFKALQRAFGETIRERRGRPDLVARVIGIEGKVVLA